MSLLQLLLALATLVIAFIVGQDFPADNKPAKPTDESARYLRSDELAKIEGHADLEPTGDFNDGT